MYTIIGVLSGRNIAHGIIGSKSRSRVFREINKKSACINLKISLVITSSRRLVAA